MENFFCDSHRNFFSFSGQIYRKFAISLELLR